MLRRKLSVDILTNIFFGRHANQCYDRKIHQVSPTLIVIFHLSSYALELFEVNRTLSTAITADAVLNWCPVHPGNGLLCKNHHNGPLVHSIHLPFISGVDRPFNGNVRNSDRSLYFNLPDWFIHPYQASGVSRIIRVTRNLLIFYYTYKH